MDCQHHMAWISANFCPQPCGWPLFGQPIVTEMLDACPCTHPNMHLQLQPLVPLVMAWQCPWLRGCSLLHLPYRKLPPFPYAPNHSLTSMHQPCGPLPTTVVVADLSTHLTTDSYHARSEAARYRPILAAAREEAFGKLLTANQGEQTALPTAVLSLTRPNPPAVCKGPSAAIISSSSRHVHRQAVLVLALLNLPLLLGSGTLWGAESP